MDLDDLRGLGQTATAAKTPGKALGALCERRVELLSVLHQGQGLAELTGQLRAFVEAAKAPSLVAQLQLAATACSEDQKVNLLSREVLSRGVAAVRRIVKQAEHYHDGLLISLSLLELAQDRATRDARRCAKLKRQINSHRYALAATQLRHQQLGAVRACDAQQQAAKQCELSVLQSRLDATATQRSSWWQEIVRRKAWRAWIAQKR